MKQSSRYLAYLILGIVLILVGVGVAVLETNPGEVILGIVLAVAGAVMAVFAWTDYRQTR
jgi:drug/metabolite transporter (DMT)-like permease